MPGIQLQPIKPAQKKGRIDVHSNADFFFTSFLRLSLDLAKHKTRG